MERAASAAPENDPEMCSSASVAIALCNTCEEQQEWAKADDCEESIELNSDILALIALFAEGIGIGRSFSGCAVLATAAQACSAWRLAFGGRLADLPGRLTAAVAELECCTELQVPLGLYEQRADLFCQSNFVSSLHALADAAEDLVGSDAEAIGTMLLIPCMPQEHAHLKSALRKLARSARYRSTVASLDALSVSEDALRTIETYLSSEAFATPPENPAWAIVKPVLTVWARAVVAEVQHFRRWPDARAMHDEHQRLNAIKQRVHAWNERASACKQNDLQDYIRW